MRRQVRNPPLEMNFDRLCEDAVHSSATGTLNRNGNVESYFIMFFTICRMETIDGQMGLARWDDTGLALKSTTLAWHGHGNYSASAGMGTTRLIG